MPGAELQRIPGTRSRAFRLRVIAAAATGVAVMSAGCDRPSGSPASGHASVDEWIEQESVPFSIDAAGEFEAAVDRVVASLDPSVELLGIGETVHGSEEILQLRNRLFQRLVEKHGYSAIAIESSFARARLVNEYVAGRGPATYEGVQEAGFGEGFGRLEANRELVEWMKRYNADPAHTVKLHFYGLDIPTGKAGIASPEQVLHFAIDYLGAVDGAAGEKYRRRVDEQLGRAADWENPVAWVDRSKAVGGTPAATALRLAAEDLINELRTRRPELVAATDPDRYAEALQHALVARQLLNFHAALARQSGEPPDGPRGVRDALMADNLVYMVERERGRGKVLAFAHNGHLQRGKSTWPCCGQKFAGTEVYTWWPAGSQLKERLGSRYAVIGNALGVSEDNGIGAPEAGSLEARLAARSSSALLLPTHQGNGLPAREVAALPTRSGSMKNLTYTALIPQSLMDFDWLLFVSSSRYMRGGTPLQNWDASSWGDSSGDGGNWSGAAATQKEQR